jgi:hypothetical protein
LKDGVNHKSKCFELIAEDMPAINLQWLTNVFTNMISCRTWLFGKSNIEKVFEEYHRVDEKSKRVIICIGVMTALFDSKFIPDTFLNNVTNDLQKAVEASNNNLHTLILFFLGVYTQQVSRVIAPDKCISLATSLDEHITYWVIEYLGRSIVADSNQSLAMLECYKGLLNNQEIYSSVIARRKIFWEFHRIMRLSPSLSSQIIKYFDDGLTDSNPDVELLAVLCMTLSDSVTMLNENQLSKILDLLHDPEDDVRETVVRESRKFSNIAFLLENKAQLINMKNDTNCHVQYEAQLTETFLFNCVK